MMDSVPVFGRPAGDDRAVFSKQPSQSVLVSVRLSTLALSPSFSLPLPPQPAARGCGEQREGLVGVVCGALAEGAPVGMKMGYQTRDEQNEGGRAMG
jgi:hypothetical protein